VTREQLVLPDELLNDIERQVVGVAAHSQRLLASGQHLKRGVLPYGAPGTGKTHTVRYLLGLLPEMTVIAISGRALGRIREACSVARAAAGRRRGGGRRPDRRGAHRAARRAPAALPAAERDGGPEPGPRS
jgi:hypothetical protein